MAVLFNATADELIRSASLPSSTSFSVCGCAIACTGTGDIDFDGYWALPSDAAFTTVNNRGADMTELNLTLGNDIANERFGGRIAAVKVWDAVLTSAELQNERHTYTPKRHTNLHLWSPLIPKGGGTSFLDYSPNSRHWTQGGTVTDVDGPPIV